MPRLRGGGLPARRGAAAGGADAGVAGRAPAAGPPAAAAAGGGGMSVVTHRTLLLVGATVCFAVQVLLELFGGHSPVDLLALGLAIGFAAFLP